MGTNEQRQTGLEKLNEINPEGYQRIQSLLKDICPDLAEMILEFPYGRIYPRAGLGVRTRELVTIASLATLGFARDQLKAHIVNALNVGCKKEEIVETILQMCVYAGFPACLNAMFIAKDVFADKGLIGR